MNQQVVHLEDNQHTPPMSSTNKNLNDSSNAQYERFVIDINSITTTTTANTKLSCEDVIKVDSEKNACRLTLADYVNNSGFYKTLSSCILDNNAIPSVELFCNQLHTAILSATKHAVQMPSLSIFHSTLNFKCLFALPVRHYLYPVYLRHCATINTLSCIFLLKPSSIDKKAVKALMKVSSLKTTNDRFDILSSILKEITPKSGNFGAIANHQTELNKLILRPGMTFSSMHSLQL